MAQDRKLRVIIVGGGLAGLAAARILREYHDVTVFERASSSNATGGQGVCFFPATVKILQSMGYDEDRAFPCHDTYFRHYDRAGKPTETIHLDYKSEWGADIWSQLRSDARDELFRLATAPAHEVGIPDACGSVNMVYKTPVVDVDTDNALVTLGDGSTVQGDLVIGKYILGMRNGNTLVRELQCLHVEQVADGIHSRLRKNVLGPDPKYKAQKMGLTIFRVAIPVEKAKEALGDDLPHWMVPDKEGKGCLTYFQSRDDSNRLIVTYPLRRFQWIHISLHLPTGDGHGDAESESWFADGNRSEIIEAFHDFDKNIIKLVK